MIQIRQGVFETNSSSTHSITMVSGDMFDKWKNGEVYLNECWSRVDKELDEKTWLTSDEAMTFARLYLVKWQENVNKINELHGEELDEFLQDECGIYTYDGFFNQYDYETYGDDYFTEGGEHVVAFGRYGWS